MLLSGYSIINLLSSVDIYTISPRRFDAAALGLDLFEVVERFKRVELIELAVKERELTADVVKLGIGGVDFIHHLGEHFIVYRTACVHHQPQALDSVTEHILPKRRHQKITVVASVGRGEIVVAAVKADVVLQELMPVGSRRAADFFKIPLMPPNIAPNILYLRYCGFLLFFSFIRSILYVC